MIGLVETPLDLAVLVAAVGDAEHGAIATFMGTTRRERDIRSVEAIEYEAYGELAATELAAIADEASRRFDAKVAVQHRTGRVTVGEPSIAIAVSTGHRPAAFAACRYVIDEVKTRLPIWKRMHFTDGSTEWQDGRDGSVEQGG